MVLSQAQESLPCIYFALHGVLITIFPPKEEGCSMTVVGKCRTTKTNGEGRVYEKASWFLFG
jgi:hypothetical protein